MADNKDFLNSLAKEVDKKPASFQEERVEKIAKKSIFTPKTIAISVVVLTVVGAAVYFLFFKPNITMENFVGKNISEFSAWAKQNDISNTGILLNEEYNFDFDKDVVMNQSVAEGTKITKDAKITFVVSKGADPDELVTFPDINSMQYDEITAWVKENKLSNTKVTTTYDAVVAADQVISYDLKSIEPSAFTRGSTLSIVVSKGPKPAATITVSTDYVNQLYTTLKTWADTNNIKVTMTEKYNSTIESGYIISLSVAKGDKVKEGETITAVVSKGPAVKMINFDKYTEQRVTDWCTANKVTVRFNEVYHDIIGKGIVVYQSIVPDKILSDDSILYVGISLGKPKLDATTNITISALQANIDALNEKDAKLSINHSYTYEINESIPVGSIVRISNLSSMTVGTNLNLVISDGKNILLVDYTDEDVPSNSVTWAGIVADPNNHSESDVSKLCSANKGVSCNFSYQNSDTVVNSNIISITRSDGKPLTSGEYIKQSVSIDVIICDKNS